MISNKIYVDGLMLNCSGSVLQRVYLLWWRYSYFNISYGPNSHDSVFIYVGCGTVIFLPLSDAILYPRPAVQLIAHGYLPYIR